MSERENKELLKYLGEYKKKVTSSKKASQKFLIELGVVDKNGKKTRHYKNLCIR